MTYQPPRKRIIKITYRSAHNRGRIESVVAKVPYSGAFALSETLTRALTIGDILWFRLEPATASEISKVRLTLMRWPEALQSTSARSGVTWLD